MMTCITKSHFAMLPLLLLIATTIFGQQPEKSVTEYVQAGVAAQRAGKHEEALQHYAAAIKLDPKNFGAQFNSGTSLMILGRRQEALSAFKIAVSLRPDDPVVQFTLAGAYSANEHTLEAIDALKETIRLDPNHFGAHRALAAYYGRQGQSADAIREFSVALQLRENDPETLTGPRLSTHSGGIISDGD